MSSLQYFENVASEWHQLRTDLFPDQLRDRAYAAADLAPGDTAADLGAGSGFLAEGLLARGLRVIAVDQSPAMLQALRERLASDPEVAARLDTRQGDAAALPIADGAVRHVFANMFLHHVEDPAAAIAEMARILEPGGRLILTDLDTHQHEFLRREQHDRWLGFARQDLRRWLADAGLESISVEGTAESCCSGSACSAERAEISVFLATAVRPGGEATGDDGDRLRRQVSARYAQAARSAAGGEQAGCGCGCDTSAEVEAAISRGLYGEGETAGLPQAAVKASLGCANPVALAVLAEGETVLDLGSGGGIDVLLSARRVGPSGKVYGVDMTDEMLALARRNQAEAGVKNVEFLKGTIEKLPLPDAAVDVVLSNCVINLSADKPETLREAFRVLRPGGRLAVADVVATRPLPPHIRNQVALWSACIAGALDVDTYRRELEAAGFVEIDIEVVRTLDPEAFGMIGESIRRDLGLASEEARGLVGSALVRARKPGEEA